MSITRLFILLGNHRQTIALAPELLNAVSIRGRVHPKVTDFDCADHQEFDRLEDAQDSMKQRKIERYDEVLKPEARDLAGPQPRGNYYAVAHGNTIGIFRDWKYRLCCVILEK